MTNLKDFNVANLEKLLNKFNLDLKEVKDIKTFVNSLTHSTYGNENKGQVSYEYLEFLGDAILQFKVTEYMFKKYSRLSEGKATTLRSQAVRTENLAKISQDLALFSLLRVSKGATTLSESAKVQADLFESFIAAIYLEFGLESVEQILKTTVYPKVDENVSTENKDSKSLFQEYMQSAERTIHYETVMQENGGFSAKVYCNNKVFGKGIGKNKKEAEEDAAKNALENLGV
ncbi:ribonuclease III [[Mycoplasma] gypis]|uniref:Ribonuclease 3 n=1 Tax=[Mycoplasma] gypis TaxID=92404 RepID=A0ABZ2RQE3_9BACT